MKKISYLLSLFLIINIIFVSCSDDNDGPEPSPTPIPSAVELDEPINDFVWKAMNSWYNWKTNVPNLADTKKDDTDEYYTYLNGYSTPDGLFNTLLYDKGNTDRFSWFIEDYVEQQKSFQGITTTTGIRRSTPVKISDTEIIIYVQHVSKGSAADNAGIKRGDIINEIDGEVMDVDNYASVINKLYSGNTIIVSTAKVENSALVKVNDFTITPTEISDNPIYLTKVFDDIDGKKVGYLVYNGFRSSYNDELNAAFALFKSEGITELILDFRINGGGSVATSAYLASMINDAAASDTFAELRFNSNHSNENGNYYFGNELNVFDASGLKTGTETINRLSGINQLYVLASGSTASASEMIINGLKPFMPVKVIGTTTYGKNVGSITLYDAPGDDYASSRYANKSHFNAMQPIVFQIYNKVGQSDYTNGFVPDIEVFEYMDWRNIKPFGDEEELLLKSALNDIRGVSSKQQVKDINVYELSNERIIQPKFENEMYLEEDYFNK